MWLVEVGYYGEGWGVRVSERVGGRAQLYVGRRNMPSPHPPCASVPTPSLHPTPKTYRDLTIRLSGHSMANDFSLTPIKGDVHHFLHPGPVWWFGA